MEKNKKIFFNSVLVTVFLIFFSFYSYKVLGFFKIVNNDNIKSAASPAVEVNSDNIDITKDNQDLLNVDYQKYYDDLKPYGTWIKINLSDYVTDKNNQKDEKGISDVLRNLLGVTDAKADMNFGWGIFYVWKPLPTLAVTLVAGEPSPAYIPYTNGRWVYSDYGWYFRAATYPEEIVHHYGRWIFVPYEGWIWVPGSRWAPSWVDWEENDEYISWTPSTPCFYLYDEYYAVPSYWQNNCVVVERRYFLDPYVYRYSREYRRHRDRHDDRHEFWDMRRIPGPEYRDQMVYNDGPDFNNIENTYGRNIDPVSINLVSNREDVKYNENQYDVYSYGAGNNSKMMNNERKNISQKKFSSNDNSGIINKESGKNNSSLAYNENKDNTLLNGSKDYTKNKDNGANNLIKNQDKGNNNNKESNKLNSRENIKGNIKTNIKENNNVNIRNDNNNRKKDNASNKNQNIGYNNSGNKVKNNEQVKSDNNSRKKDNISNRNQNNGYNNSGNKVKNNNKVKPDNNSGIKNNTYNKSRNNENKINQGNKTNNNERGNVVNKNQKKDFSSQPKQNQRNEVRPNNKIGKSEKNNAGNNNGKREYIYDTKMSPNNKNNYVSPNNNKGNNTSVEKNNGKRIKK